jgi:hypothetical protein
MLLGVLLGRHHWASWKILGRFLVLSNLLTWLPVTITVLYLASLGATFNRFQAGQIGVVRLAPRLTIGLLGLGMSLGRVMSFSSTLQYSCRLVGVSRLCAPEPEGVS